MEIHSQLEIKKKFNAFFPSRQTFCKQHFYFIFLSPLCDEPMHASIRDSWRINVLLFDVFHNVAAWAKRKKSGSNEKKGMKSRN